MPCASSCSFAFSKWIRPGNHQTYKICQIVIGAPKQFNQNLKTEAANWITICCVGSPSINLRMAHFPLSITRYDRQGNETPQRGLAEGWTWRSEGRRFFLSSRDSTCRATFSPPSIFPSRLSALSKIVNYVPRGGICTMINCAATIYADSWTCISMSFTIHHAYPSSHNTEIPVLRSV